jgi:GntR family transcriptional regulator
LDLLVRKGLLVRRRGSGTFVCEPRQEVDLFSLDGTGASFAKKGLTVESRILAPVARDVVDPAAENPFSGRPAYGFSRLTLVNRAPVLVEDFYLHPELFSGIEAIALEGRSLSRIAEERYFLRPVGGRQNFRIAYLDVDRSRLLEVRAGTPVLEVRRFIDFPQMESGVYATFLCRTDRFVFSQHIGGPDYA